MIKYIDSFLNQITMYRLVVYGLLIEAALAIGFATFGWISASPWQLIFALVILVGVAQGVNKILVKLFQAIPNTESSLITALLLFFVMDHSVTNIRDVLVLVAVAMIAVSSKYIFAIHCRHVFNPVAIAAAIIGMSGIGFVTWWIATPVLFIPILIFGLLVVRKIRRFHLFFSFVVVASIVALLHNISFTTFLLSWPIIFFGTLMLTEPRTAPARRRDQIIFGVLVGFLFSSISSFGKYSLTPELALVIGNIFAYFISSKQVLRLHLKSVKSCTPQIFDFAFVSDLKPNFLPGQYLEWTLPIVHADTRGNRRYFTIASSPTDEELHLGVRIDQSRSSMFKKTLLDMKEGDCLVASHLAGEFILPIDKNKKLLFVAGGIGITPFWSMTQWLYSTKQKRDIVLFYAANNEEDFAYQKQFEAMKEIIGMEIIYLVSKPSSVWQGVTGFLTKELIEAEVPDYHSRYCYLSGPNAMVENYRHLLKTMGIKRSQIKTDYFPGF